MSQLRSFNVQGVRRVPLWYSYSMFQIVKAVLMELLCTCLFLFITIGSIANQCRDPNYTPAGTLNSTCPLTQTFVFNISMTFGITIFVLVYAAAAFSGAHFNPAVSIALLVANKISVMRCACYVVAQMAGATAGVGLVKAMNPHYFNLTHGAANFIAEGVSVTVVWFMEAILTFLLTFMVLAATDRIRGKTSAHLPVLAPLSIGLTVFLACMVAIPMDGCSLNPARTFATSIIVGDWTEHWVFWVGPISGSITAALIYELAFRPNYDHEDVKEEPSKEPLPRINTRGSLDIGVAERMHAAIPSKSFNKKPVSQDNTEKLAAVV